MAISDTAPGLWSLESPASGDKKKLRCRENTKREKLEEERKKEEKVRRERKKKEEEEEEED